MTSTADIIFGAIDERRNTLTAMAETITAPWFDSASGRRIQRLYVPLVRITMTTRGTRTVRVYWSRRLPVNSFRGKLIKDKRTGENRRLSVQLVYIPARRTGAAYPDNLFRHASADELQDIRRVESQLAPIRLELRSLGSLLRAVQAYARSTPCD